MDRAITTVVTGMTFLECPRWRDGRIWFVDFYSNRVLSANEDGSDLRLEVDVPNQPSGLGWLPDGRLLVVSMRDARVLRRELDGTMVTHADLEAMVGGLPNDMVVDDHGRGFVGNFGFDLMGGAPLAPAALLRVDPDGSVVEVATDMWFPNGSVITEDGVLLVGETFGNRVTAFDVGADGGLVNRRVWAQFGELPPTSDVAEAMASLSVAPDGCCLDTDGALWIADAIGGRVVRVVEGGAITDEIAIGMGAYACMLGGADGRTLFICAAPDFHEDSRRDATDACLLAVRVEIPHAGLP